MSLFLGSVDALTDPKIRVEIRVDGFITRPNFFDTKVRVGGCI